MVGDVWVSSCFVLLDHSVAGVHDLLLRSAAFGHGGAALHVLSDDWLRAEFDEQLHPKEQHSQVIQLSQYGDEVGG